MSAMTSRLSRYAGLTLMPELAVLVGGAINGLAVHVARAWHSETSGSIFHGISPFELITLGIASLIVLQAQAEPGETRTAGWPEALTAAAFLIPSSAASWLALALYAGWLASRSSGQRRLGTLLFAGMALAALWSSVALKVVATPVTSAEAAVVGHLLALFKADVSQSGNVVGVLKDHVLVIMTACSTLDLLPKAVVGLAAVMWLAGSFQARRFFQLAALLAVFVFAANMIRLTIMASSTEAYLVTHGPIGANIFDASMILALFALALWETPE